MNEVIKKLQERKKSKQQDPKLFKLLSTPRVGRIPDFPSINSSFNKRQDLFDRYRINRGDKSIDELSKAFNFKPEASSPVAPFKDRATPDANLLKTV